MPAIRGGGIEHVVSVLAGRAAEHHLILDSFEGVAANQSTVANQLGSITAQVAASKHDAGYAGTACSGLDERAGRRCLHGCRSGAGARSRADGRSQLVQDRRPPVAPIRFYYAFSKRARTISQDSD
jgi:hypothetical protein